jgi:ribonuclease G
MAKEMIISVNGREKKIAVLDNGQVTEFYIERGEDNSAIVGNIYKGRVQRVLPGMQSAFVEIGLERDAFLYVSDFFDEEEELERIIMDKGKKAPSEEVDKEVTDELYRARLEREHQMEAAQEIAEPLAESGVPVASVEEQPVDEKGGRGKRGRSRRGRRDQQEEKQPELVASGIELELDDSGFERVVDDEAMGEMFKDAYVQEAIVDKVRAVEFEMESVGVAEVGSVIAEAANEGGFERIADEDEDSAPAPEKKAKPKAKGRTSNSKKEAVAAKEGPSEAAASEDDPEELEEKKKKAAKARAKTGMGKKTAKKKKKDGESDSDDAEAGIAESTSNAEMSVRRGGRRRRRSGGKPGGSAQSEDRFEENEESVTAETEVASADLTPVAEESSNGSGSGSGGGRRGGRRDRGDRRERSQPMITDLLREGQEILVQMAKEPIARKGARITSHIALPGRFLVYMPTIEHVGVSRKIQSANERGRLRHAIQKIRAEEDVPSGGFIVRTAGIGIPEEDLRNDARYLVRTWKDIKKTAEKSKSPALVHQDLDLIQRILRDQLNDDFAAIRVDSEEEYLRIVEFVNRIQPKMVNRVKLYTRDEPILENFGVQEEIDKAIKPRVWLKSGGYLVINQTEALVAIDVNTGKFVGKGNARLEDTITKTNMEAVEEIARQIRLRDLGGIIVLDLIDMEDRRNRHKVLQALQEHLSRDKSPTKVLSFNDFGLIIMTRKRVKQSLERTLCSPCEYCQGAGLVKSAQTVCYEILDEARRVSKGSKDSHQVTLRVNPAVAKALRSSERVVLEEIEEYIGAVDITSDPAAHQEQFDFAFI